MRKRQPAASPRLETFELPLDDGRAIRVEGWNPDLRRRQGLRVVLPDGPVVLVEGRGEGWFVRMEDDEPNCAGGELTACVAVVLGWWDDQWPDEWPTWVWALEAKLGARDPGRQPNRAS